MPTVSEGLCEPRALEGDPIHVRRFQDRMTGHAHRVGALIVGHHDDEVGTLSTGRGLLGECPERPGYCCPAKERQHLPSIDGHEFLCHSEM